MVEKIKSFFVFIYWLLIKSSKEFNYDEVIFETIDVESKGKKIKVDIYKPKSKIRRTCILSVGLNYEGPNDIRAKRLASVFAKAGYLVYVPYLEDYLLLNIKDTTYIDFFSCFDHLYEVSLRYKTKPYVFSVSFGSCVALKLAQDIKRSSQIGSMVLFGAYGNWFETCKKIIEKESKANEPVQCIPIIFHHFLEDALEEFDSKRTVIIKEAIWACIIKTWDEKSFTTKEHIFNILSEGSFALSEKETDLVLMFFALKGNTWDFFLKYANKEKYNYLNPLGEKTQINCPIRLMHSISDEVIPVDEYTRLVKLLPPEVIQQKFLTSYYQHSQKVEGSKLSSMKNLLKDLYQYIILFWHLAASCHVKST
jgi:hypothetical protein